MKKNYIALMVFVLGIVSNASAQQLPLSSQYHQNMLTINPAYSGFENNLFIAASHRTMLTGLSGSPQTNYVSVSGQGADGKMGLAFIGFHDQTNIFSVTSGMVNYAYKAKLSETAMLNFGLGVGIQNFGVDLEKAKVSNELDPILLGSVRQNRMAFNGEFGVLLQVKGLELGVAVPQLLSNNPTFTDGDGQTLNFNTVRHIRGSLKYDFMLNEDQTVKFYPLVVVRSVKGAPFQWDINGVLDMTKYGWIGVTYHSTYAISFSAGLRHKGFSVGYAHDIPMGIVNDFSKRSSEFILSYRIGNNTKQDDKRLDKIQKELDDLYESNTEQDEKIDELTETKAKLEKELKELEKKQAAENEEMKNKLKNAGSNTNSSNGQGTNTSPNTSNNTSTSPKNNSDAVYRGASANSFTDEQGKPAKKGYYVVIGSFEMEKNAQNWKKKSIAKGDKNTSILYDSSIKMHQVVAFYSENQDPAVAERSRKSAKQKAWILRLE
jgi:type IX secretion system PorP/SprF family membrane protein